MRPLLAIALVAAAGVGTAAPAEAAAAGGGGVKLASIAFAQQSVDASAGGASVELDWALTDGDAAATNVSGEVLLQQVSASGQAIGPDFTITYSFQPGNADVYAASGTAASSTYTYDFTVPQYAASATATWAVVKVTAADDQSHSLAVGRNKLAALAGSSFSATELVDSTAPTYGGVATPSLAATYFDDANAPVDVTYGVEALDAEAGFYKGVLVVSGPGGQSVTTDFAVQFDAGGSTVCEGISSWGSADIDCEVPVVFPQGSAAGTWVVSRIALTDAAGNTANYRRLSLAPVTLTQNAVLSASGFSISPTVYDSWLSQQRLTVTMTPAGAKDGIASVTLDTNPLCYGGTTSQPTVAADGSVSVTVIVSQGPYNNVCDVDGIAIIDGAGDLAAYGSFFDGPALSLNAKLLPDTAPVALSAALGSTSVVNGSTAPDELNLGVSSIAGVNRVGFGLYDASGNWTGYSAFANVADATSGTISVPIYPGSLAPGTYTVGFMLYDTGSMESSYGYPNGVGSPAPDGPLQVTVTAS